MAAGAHVAAHDGGVLVGVVGRHGDDTDGMGVEPVHRDASRRRALDEHVVLGEQR